MAEPALTSMPSTAMAIRESPAVSTISRKFVTVNLSAVNLVRRMISTLRKMMISSPNNYMTTKAVGQACRQSKERYGEKL